MGNLLAAITILRNLRLLIIIAIALITLAACTPDPNEVFIQGNWYYNDPHIMTVDGESFNETFWAFENGTYETTTCCFTRFQQYGRYDILESEGDTMTLVLFNIDGRLNSDRVPIKVLIDREADTIKIARLGPLTRIFP